MKKERTSQQEQWRLGYIAGIKKSMEKITELEDEINDLRLDRLLLRIMKSIGIEDQESGHYWHGMEQALEIYCDLLSEPDRFKGAFGVDDLPRKPA